MRKTVPVRVSANLHSEIARLAAAANVPITVVFDLACTHLINSNVDISKLIKIAESAYDAAITQGVAPIYSAPPEKKSSAPAAIDDLDIDQYLNATDTTDISDIL